MERIEVTICGKKYILKTEEDKEYLQALAAELNDRFEELLKDNEDTSFMDAAVLIGLETMDKATKADVDGDHIRLRLGEYVKKIDELEKQLKEQKEALEKLQIENTQLKTEIEILQLKACVSRQTPKEKGKNK